MYMVLNLCSPAILYIGFSLTQIIIDIFKHMYNTALLKFIIMIENNLIVKYNQSQYFKQYLLTNDTNIKLEIHNKCNYEKHVNEDFNYEMYDGLINKNLYNYYSNINVMRKKCLFSIANNNLHEKLKPINLAIELIESNELNFPIEEKVKKNKIKISDEIILRVRERLNEGNLNIEIENEFKLSRHIVSRIKNNILVLTNETKRNNSKKTQEQKNVNRRKISIQIILKIIDKLIENKLPSIILNNILEENINEDCKLTIDIVKNIKRKIKDKVVPFYKFEISSNLFEHYEQLINNSTII